MEKIPLYCGLLLCVLLFGIGIGAFYSGVLIIGVMCVIMSIGLGTMMVTEILD